MTPVVGLAQIGTYEPTGRASLQELEASGRLESPAETLRDLGFAEVDVADEGHEAVDMAVRAARQALKQVDPTEVGALVYGSAMAPAALASRSSQAGAAHHVEDVHELFKYAATRLHAELGLCGATVLGVDQQGCTAMFGAIRVARGLLAAEPELRSVLCVCANRLPSAAPREIVYNAIADGAGAALVTRDPPANRILDCYQVTKGAYWDGVRMRNELLAGYFPTSRAVINEALRRAGLRVGDLDWIVPHNVSLRSWEILLRLLNVPRNKLYSANIARRGHNIAADHMVNLKDMEEAGLLQAGQRLLLFNFGFGAHWSTIILEH